MHFDCCKNDLQARKKFFFYRNKLLHLTTGWRAPFECLFLIAVFSPFVLVIIPQKNSITYFFIHIYLSIFCCFYLYISYPLNQLLQYTSSWDVSCYSVVGWDWAKYVQPVKFGPLQPAVVSTVNDRKPCPVYFFFCVGFIFTFSFKIAVMWVLLSAADCA